MRWFLCLLLFLPPAVYALPVTVNIHLTLISDETGLPVQLSDIASTRLYWIPGSGSVTGPTVQIVDIPGTPPSEIFAHTFDPGICGPITVAATATDTSGDESRRSNEVYYPRTDTPCTEIPGGTVIDFNWTAALVSGITPPNLSEDPIVGGPFDCGSAPVQTMRSYPVPLTLPQRMGVVFGEIGNGSSHCWEVGSFVQFSGSWTGQPWPDVQYQLDDVLTYARLDVLGDFILGGQRMEIHFIDGAVVHGNVICGPNAADVAFHGEASNTVGGYFSCP